MLGWILSLTLTARSRMWMCPLLLPSLVNSPWSQQPHKTRNGGQKIKKNKYDRYPHINLVPVILETTGWPGPQPGNSLATSCEMSTTPHWPSGTPGQPSKVCSTAPSPNNNSQPPSRDPQYHRHNQFSFSAPRFWMQVPSWRKRTQRLQFQAYRSRAMRPSCDFTSSDDDDHNTDNNFFLLLADVGHHAHLLEGLTEVDVRHVALGCRFALDIFTIPAPTFHYT